MAEIVVQPPAKIQKGVTLYPPLVVRTPETASNIFVYLVVLDSHKQPVTGNRVLGQTMKNPQPLVSGGAAEEAAAGEHYEYIVFDDIIINTTGTFKLVVNRCEIDSIAGQSTHIDRVVSRSVRVHTGSVATEEPSAEELGILELLRNEGLVG